MLWIYLILLFLPIVKYNIDPKNGINNMMSTHINLSFPLNSFFRTLIKAKRGKRRKAIIIINCHGPTIPNKVIVLNIG